MIAAVYLTVIAIIGILAWTAPSDAAVHYMIAGYICGGVCVYALLHSALHGDSQR